MLILELNQVQSILVQCSQSGETFYAVSYRDHFYRQVETFNPDQKQSALQRAKQIFLDHKGNLAVLVLEEAYSWGIWQEDNALTPCALVPPPSLAETLNLEDLVAQMRNVGGIDIRDRRHNLTVYQRCFVGAEVVDWFSNTFELSRQDAVQLGQRLVDDRWIHHVANDHEFKDEYLFYRFYWDEDKPVQ